MARVGGCAGVSGLVVITTALLGAWSAGARAEADQRLEVKNGVSVRVVLGSRRVPAVGVRAARGSDGWALKLPSDLSGTSFSLTDVTPDAPPTRWLVSASGNVLHLDPTRFLPSHVYEVEATRPDGAKVSGHVYLYPPAARRVTRVSYGSDEVDRQTSGEAATSDAADAPIAPVPKGEL